MAQYIDKDALAKEIERLKADALQKKDHCKRSGLEKIMHQKGAYNKILSFINTFEVKEVDWEKETDKWYNNEASKEFENVLYKDIEKCAKHFFELGLSVNNPVDACVEMILKLHELKML